METLILTVTFIILAIGCIDVLVNEYKETQENKTKQSLQYKIENRRRMEEARRTRYKTINSIIYDDSDKLFINLQRDAIPIDTPESRTPKSIFNEIKSNCLNYNFIVDDPKQIECYHIEDNQEGIQFLCSCVENNKLDVLISTMNNLSKQGDTSEIYEYLNQKYNITKRIFNYAN